MSLPRIVVDNSAMIPAFFPEEDSTAFDARLVTHRARSLVRAIRLRRVNAYVPPSFFREFLNVATAPLGQPQGKSRQAVEQIRAQWDDLLLLPLITVPLQELLHLSAMLTFDDSCPAPDAWYVAAAINTRATLWISHSHRDGLVSVASRHRPVRLLSEETPAY